jgi:hypothetical protein
MSTALIEAEPAAETERYDHVIAEAETRIEEQRQLIRESTLVGREITDESFDLEKMELLVTILREARSRAVRGA